MRVATQDDSPPRVETRNLISTRQHISSFDCGDGSHNRNGMLEHEPVEAMNMDDREI